MAKPDNPEQVALFDSATMAGPTALVQLTTQRREIAKCERCGLHETRRMAVPGDGKWDRPAIAFIGEAPGEQEDAKGRPFVGASGQFLDRLLACIGLTRADVFVTNMVACRPEKNRTPTTEELRACQAHWLTQIELVRPRVIVALGKTAATALTGKGDTMFRLRGRWWSWKGTPLRVTWHPAYVLRHDEGRWGEARRQVWSDMQAVAGRLEIPIAKAVLDRIAAMEDASDTLASETAGADAVPDEAVSVDPMVFEDGADEALEPLPDLPAFPTVDNSSF